MWCCAFNDIPIHTFFSFKYSCLCDFHWIGIIVLFIFQRKKVKFKWAKYIAQGHMFSKCQSWSSCSDPDHFYHTWSRSPKPLKGLIWSGTGNITLSVYEDVENGIMFGHFTIINPNAYTSSNVVIVFIYHFCIQKKTASRCAQWIEFQFSNISVRVLK